MTFFSEASTTQADMKNNILNNFILYTLGLSSLVTAATVETFTDRAIFLASAGDIVAEEDFEGFTGDTVLSTLVNDATAFDGFTITSAPPLDENAGFDHNIISDPNDSTFNGFGNIPGNGLALGPSLRDSSQSLVVTIDAPAFAIGYDYVSFSNNNHNSVHIFDFADGTSFSINPKGDLTNVGDGLADFSNLGNSGFFGLTSDSQIITYRVEFIDTDSVEGFGIDNIVLTVPEPSSGVLVALGGLALLRRKRQN